MFRIFSLTCTLFPLSFNSFHFTVEAQAFGVGRFFHALDTIIMHPILLVVLVGSFTRHDKGCSLFIVATCATRKALEVRVVRRTLPIPHKADVGVVKGFRCVKHILQYNDCVNHRLVCDEFVDVIVRRD